MHFTKYLSRNSAIAVCLTALLATNLHPAQADELEIEYCYCRTPDHRRAWVKYFDYASAYGDYMWNARCGPEPANPAPDEEHCFNSLYDGPDTQSSNENYHSPEGWRGQDRDHERFEHCNAFEDGTVICTNGFSYRVNGKLVEKLPGQGFKIDHHYTENDREIIPGPGGKETEYADPNRVVTPLMDCEEHCRLAFPEIGDIGSTCNVTDRETGYIEAKHWVDGDWCRVMRYKKLKDMW